MLVQQGRTLPSDAEAWRLPNGVVAIALLLAAAAILLFWDGLVWMWDVWMMTPEYSHGVIIPFLSAFLIWQKKDSIAKTPMTGSWGGVALVALGGLMLIVGQLGTVYTIVQYAFVATVAGIVLAFCGRRAFRLFAVPLLFLAFMIPPPYFVLHNLSTKLQLLSSELGVRFMRLLDISVFVEGNVIDLGGYKLQVAEACDGLRYLFPMMTLGFLFAYFYRGAMWKRIVVFLSSVFITVFMNSFRIGTIGVMVEHWGIGMAEGFLHEFQGWAVFMFSAALMLGEIALLNRVGHESGTWRQLFGIEFPAPTPRGSTLRNRTMPAPFVAAAALLLTLLGVSLLLPRPAEIVPQRASLQSFPLQLGAWQGRVLTMEGVYQDALKLDDYLLADYADGGASPVNLYVAYYNSQRKGEAVHSPRSCLPGGGWQFRSFEQRTLGDIKVDGVPLRVNRAVIEYGAQRQLVYYWFQQRGRVITNEFAVKWYLLWDSLTRHRTDGALVRLIVELPPASSEKQADRRLTDLAALVAPSLSRYVPD
jgi:exosortase D (VPLPA-CTERM-specific)